MRPFELLAHNAQRFPEKKALSDVHPHAGDSGTLTWREAYERFQKFGNFLRNQNIAPGDRVGICARNSSSWVLLDWVLHACGYVSIPFYTQSAQREVDFICKETELKVVFSDTKSLTFPSSVRVISIQELENGSKNCPSDFSPTPLPDEEVFSIIYTSGTSGEPKGVMHTMAGAIAAIGSVQEVFGFKPKDRFFSYLPLSHIAERVLVSFVGLSSAGHLTFLEKIERLAQALPTVKPTVFFAVPRIWDLFKGKIQRDIEENQLLQQRLQAIPSFLRQWVLGIMVRKKIGLCKAKFMASAAAKLSVETSKVLQRYGMNVLEAYGLTETMGASYVNRPGKLEIGTVGYAFPLVETKLAEDGEVWIKSPFNFVGYYKQQELTRAQVEDGWFKTGDIGKWDKQGRLMIVDRKRDIFKTTGGKFVAPQPIELMLKENPMIRDAVIIGDGRDHCVALVCLDKDFRAEKDLALWVDRVNHRLAPHEQLKSVGCFLGTWSTESGELTASQKVKRRVILDRYRAQIEELYSKKTKVTFFMEDKNSSAHLNLQ